MRADRIVVGCATPFVTFGFLRAPRRLLARAASSGKAKV